jgi:YD repeat-containing protein
LVVLTYDEMAGKVASVTRTDKATKKTTWSRFTYDLKGNLLHATDSADHDVTLAYDSKGRIMTMTNRRAKSKSVDTVRFTYNENSKPVVIRLDGMGEITVTYKENGETDKVESTAGRAIALTITQTFQELLDVVRPAGVSLTAR